MTYLTANLSGALNNDDRVKHVVLEHGERNLADCSLVEFIAIVEEHEHLVVARVNFGGIPTGSLGHQSVERVAGAIIPICELLLSLGKALL